MSDDEFADALEEQEERPSGEAAAAAAAVGGGGASAGQPDDSDPPIQDTLREFGPKEERKVLPSERPKSYSGLWSAMKSAIGKDLSKITMPVQYNEPLSFLQRLCEDLEYHEIADNAVENCSNSLERLAHACAFASTCFASSYPGFRVYKPFNPLLGETYELVQPEAGYRVVAEQVMHHPPVTVLHAESTKGWVFREEYRADSKFRGTLKVMPKGVGRLELPTGDVFTWGKPYTTVHNLIFGKVWVDQEGNVDVVNHTTGDRCTMVWTPYSTTKEYTKLWGKVCTADGKVAYTVYGAWHLGLCLIEGDAEIAILPPPEEMLQSPNARIIWKVRDYPEEAQSMYGFPRFTLKLNQPQSNVCPTDTRLRPDQSLLENGDMDNASKEKRRVEEKQRAARKERQAKGQKYKPRWFQAATEENTGLPLYTYKGGYWSAKHSGEFAKKQSFSDIF